MSSIVRPGDWLYGMQLPIQTLTKTLADPWQEHATVDDLVMVAQRAEQTGHQFIGVCDHIAIPDDEYSANMTTTWFDTVATLGFLAAHTTTIRLLSVVYVLPYRHPLQTAKAFGTLDYLSGGRAILGAGAGHVAGEFDALGVDYRRRGALLDEALAAIRGAYRETYASFNGEMFSYERVGLSPRPVQGEFPIWVGGMGKRAWERVGRLADGYIPMGNAVEQYPEIVDTIEASAQRADRAGGFDIGFMPGPAYLTGPMPEDLAPAKHTSPESLTEEIRAARQAGANAIHVQFRGRSLQDYLEQIDAFAELVVPAV